MSGPISASRRRFLAQIGWGAGALAGGAWGLDGRSQARADDVARGGAFDPDLEVALTATPTRARMLPGGETDVWSFRGRVLGGDPRALEDVPSGALGPTLRVRTGQRVRVILSSDIGEPTIVHWHGLHVPPVADGHPSLAIDPGGRYVYEFEVPGPAATYWYHAHPDRRTGEQIYRGLAGLFIVEDPRAPSLGLPGGPFDVALVIQDRRFDAHNQLVYLTSPMERMTGFLGDRVLVNGQADYRLRVAARPYRLRLLNASNSRIYRLAWADGSPLTVLGTDGGLLETPQPKPYVMLAPGERLELWADFGAPALRSETALVSQAFDAASPMAMGGVPQGAPLTIARVSIDRPGADHAPLPARLRAMPRYRLTDAVNMHGPRRIVATMQHMGFALNGRTFQMNEVAPDEHVKLGTLEAWEFDNTAGAGRRGMGMMGMSMPHPFHVHTGQFQVIRREGVAHAGYVDDGWKDTVLVMPGEKATMLMRFADFPGTYLYHCHNLEHEDAGMMRNFRVDS